MSLSAPTPKSAVILSQNGAPVATPSSLEPTVETLAQPPPAVSQPQGFWGWLSGLWHGVFRIIR